MHDLFSPNSFQVKEQKKHLESDIHAAELALTDTTRELQSVGGGLITRT